MSDARVAMNAVMRAFGVPAVVTRPAPDNAPITTIVAWVNPETDGMPNGLETQRNDEMKLMVLMRDDVPTVPRKTIVVAPERKGGANKTWRVDGIVGRKTDETRVLVVEA